MPQLWVFKNKKKKNTQHFQGLNWDSELVLVSDSLRSETASLPTGLRASPGSEGKKGNSSSTAAPGVTSVPMGCWQCSAPHGMCSASVRVVPTKEQAKKFCLWAVSPLGWLIALYQLNKETVLSRWISPPGDILAWFHLGSLFLVALLFR